MNKIPALLALCGLLAAVPAAQAAEIDLTFPQQRGQVLVTDSFNKIGKSDISVEKIKEMQKTIDRLAAEVKTLKDQVAKLDKASNTRTMEQLSKEMRSFKDRLSALERKINKR